MQTSKRHQIPTTNACANFSFRGLHKKKKITLFRSFRGPPPENFEKLDAISCNLAYIFVIRMASDIIQNWAFAAEQKTVTGTISKPTDIR